MEVIAARVAEWVCCPVTAEEALDADRGGQHRRYMVHGTSHHLGIDVHDCAQARRDMYYDGLLEPGMVFTIEPGLYFQIDDLTVPEEYRGIGVRIEDDIVMTSDGPVNMSAGIPRTADEVEDWIAPARPVSFTPPASFTTRPTLRGSFGMSASTHWTATATAQSVLERGGNAFDAAVAAAFVLHIVEPHINGPGGDLVAIVRPAGTDEPIVLMGQGPAPSVRRSRRSTRAGSTSCPGAADSPPRCPAPSTRGCSSSATTAHGNSPTSWTTRSATRATGTRSSPAPP